MSEQSRLDHSGMVLGPFENLTNLVLDPLLLVMAFVCASTGIGIFVMWFSTRAQFITGPWMILCPYRYRHCCMLVQYQYGHSLLLILAFNCASTGIGISAFWFSTSMGTVHYQNWHLIMVPVLVLAYLHFRSVPVWAHSINGTGIQK